MNLNKEKELLDKIERAKKLRRRRGELGRLLCALRQYARSSVSVCSGGMGIFTFDSDSLEDVVSALERKAEVLDEEYDGLE